MSRHPAPKDAPRLATAGDAATITQLLADAFANDLMWGSSWAFPDPEARGQQRRAVFSILVGGALRYSWVWLTDDVTAAALWIPPGGKELSEKQEAALTTMLAESLPDSADRLIAGFELIEAARPRAPHYYLTLFGSDPSRAGQGIGLGLLRHNLALIDAEGAPAYLEASTDLVPLYERHGFTVVGTFELPDGPTVNTMWRPAVNAAAKQRNAYSHGRSASGL